MSPPRIALGAVARAHGLQGAVRVKVFNIDTTTLRTGARLWMEMASRPARLVDIVNVTRAPDLWIVELAGVTTREGAEALKGATLSVDRDALPEPEEGEFYLADLVGCEVRDATDRLIGTVRVVNEYPSVDALEVDRGTERPPLEVPLVEGIVLSVDVVARRVVIDAERLEE